MTSIGHREVVLDTETTGLDSESDRIVEVGCVELVDGLPTGRTFQLYVNPEMPMPYGAFRVHGLSSEMLSTKPLFAAIADELLVFIGDSPLVMHNADFDLGFLNAELKRCDRQSIDATRAVDTVKMARAKFPGAQASLDALCRRFDISLADRKVHGALKDAKLLSQVYLQLNGGRQGALVVDAAQSGLAVLPGISPSEWAQKLVYPTDAEAAAHAAFIASIQNAVWGAP